MKWIELLMKIRKLADDDGALKEEALMEDILDYLALSGIEGASEAYMDFMEKKIRMKEENNVYSTGEQNTRKTK